jgi:Protein of unknown function (DUF2721)
MSVETIARTIQFILAPVVMITSCAILVSGVLSLYAAINDRLRALAKERLELLRGPADEVSMSTLAGDAFKTERLDEIDAQLPGLLRRHELVHRSALAIYTSIALFVVSMFVIALASAPGAASLATMALIVFLVGTAVLLLGVVAVGVEIRTSNQAVRYEVRRVMGLGK